MQVFKDEPKPARLPGQPWNILDASKFLGVSDRHLIKQIDLGKVQTIRIGKRRLIPDAELHRVATQGID